MSAKSFLYDVFVIGGGSGGLAASKACASFNAKVALANYVKPTPMGTVWGLGGTCVNVGCIPKKMMHFAASLGHLRGDQTETGWNKPENNTHDWKKMINGIDSHIKRLNKIYESGLESGNVEYFNAKAVVKDKHTITLTDADGKTQDVTAKYIIIAVGGRPTYLPIDNAEKLCITSDDLFYLQNDPGKTLIVGSGYIGLESAGFLRGFGKEVDLLYRSSPLRTFDTEMVNRVTEDMSKSGVIFKKGNLTRIEKEGDKLRAHMELENEGMKEEATELYDTVMLAVGRTPNNERIGLKNAGVDLDDKGYAKVNEKCQTNIDNIYVLGDGNDIGPELTPVAIKQGRMVANGIFNNTWKKIDYKTVPTTVFTPLEYGCAGYTEEKAIEEYGEDNIDVYHTQFKPLEWVFLQNFSADLCYTKIIIERESRKILGVHYTGPNAGEVIQSYAISVRLGLPVDALFDTIGIHPTTAEELVTLESTKRENPVAQKTGC